MNDRTKAAFTSAADLAKQLLTLGTAVLAVTVTFSKDLIERIPESDRWLLWMAWLLLALSLAGGILALMALTGALGSDRVEDSALNVYTRSIQIPFVLQILLFGGGLAFLIVAGAAAIDVSTPPSTPG
jgi:hypothetical protein